ncbi:hypothetical protein BC628DRAFT_1411047 [Trametes gibbosa]|nr:hypothetical protein BC628DRAFT_1411047 [Trametes gibbosa]
MDDIWQPRKRCRVTIEEVEDEDSEGQSAWVREEYPGLVATSLGQAVTHFKAQHAEQTALKQSPHAPFTDNEEWGLAKWLVKRGTHTGIDEFCKLPITRNRTQLSFKNKVTFFKKVDLLPTGPKWICDIISIISDQIGPNGEALTEEVELWQHDAVECCQDLIVNLVFINHICSQRYYGKSNNTEWWWDAQGKLPASAVVVPLIFALDKTNLTVLRGDQSMWLVHMSIANIDKSVRCQPSTHATVLLGYVPVSKLHCFKKATRSEALYRLFHICMAKIVAPLISAGEEGVLMTCADGHIRRVHPILATYVADYPEQCLIACCKENCCPRCLVPRKLTANFLWQVGEGQTPSQFTTQGLHPVHRPFWADLPCTDIFQCLTPDILHQLHKGVIKDHLLVWCQKIVGKAALDERVAAMPGAHGLRHFKRGVSIISQWTGGEAKELEKILLGVLNRRMDVSVQKAAR